jgi:hypothetical protein
VPFFLLRVAVPTVKVLVGSITAETFRRRLPENRSKVPWAPSARLPSRLKYVSPVAVKVQIAAVAAGV